MSRTSLNRVAVLLQPLLSSSRNRVRVNNTMLRMCTTDANLQAKLFGDADNTPTNLTSSPFRQFAGFTEPTEVILNDHSTVKNLWLQYNDNKEFYGRKHIAYLLIKNISMHGAIEEEVLYPAIRRMLPSFADAISKSISDHLSVKQQLAVLDKMKFSDPNYEQLLEKVMVSVLSHIREEEEHVLPKLRDVLTPDQRERLVKALVQARDHAPTRPHPAAPAKGGLATKAANRIASIFDKAKDYVFRNPEEKKRVPPGT